MRMRCERLRSKIHLTGIPDKQYWLRILQAIIVENFQN